MRDEIRYLSLRNAGLINDSEGGGGLVAADRGGVEAVLGRPMSGAGEVEFFPTLWEKAACYLHGFATTQHFADANKRTGWLSCLLMLQINDEDIVDIDDDTTEKFVLGVAANEYSVLEIAAWLYRHAKPLVAALDDNGECVFCGTDGPLPGAELFHRPYLRTIGVRTQGALVQEWNLPGDDGTPEQEYGVRDFHMERDLIPGVCGTCRDGWIRSLGSKLNTALDPVAQGRRPARFSTMHAQWIASWLVRSALLRALLDPAVPQAWIREQSVRLRQEQRTPRNWTVWITQPDPPWFGGGRLAFVRIAAGGPVDVVQHTPSIGLLTAVVVYDATGGGFAAAIAARAASQGLLLHQLWPSAPSTLPFDAAIIGSAQIDGELDGILTSITNDLR